MERFIGKIAVVTGSSAGIGSAISRELVKNGVIVVGLARRMEKLEKLAEELLSLESSSGKFYPLKCDLTKESDIEESFQWITSKIGPITILVNNAGVIKFSLLTDATAESISKIFDTNVKAVILCSKHAVKSMIDNSIDGHIININSIAGHCILSIQPSLYHVYTSSKHALKVISEGLRRELIYKNTNIKVTNLSPGTVHTEITRELPPRYTEKMILNAKNIAEACISVLNTPPNVLISELTVMPIHQSI